MTDHGLSSQQLAVICALSSGATMIAAAQEAGIHRNTINNWRRNHLPFQHAFAHAQYDRALFFREKAEAMFDLALQSIREILADPKTSPSVRLRAALAITALATTPPEPRKQVERDIEKIILQNSPPSTVTEDQPSPRTEPVPNEGKPEIAHKNAQPEPQPTVLDAPNPPIVHKNAQSLHNSAESAQPVRPEGPKVNHPKVGRNEPCPCGSGKKNKKCCLDNPQVRPEFAQLLTSAA